MVLSLIFLGSVLSICHSHRSNHNRKIKKKKFSLYTKLSEILRAPRISFNFMFSKTLRSFCSHFTGSNRFNARIAYVIVKLSYKPHQFRTDFIFDEPNIELNIILRCEREFAFQIYSVISGIVFVETYWFIML